MASSSSSLPDRARRFVWEPGDVEPVVSEATDEELLREVNKRALLEHVTGAGHGPKAQKVHAGGSFAGGVPVGKPKKDTQVRNAVPGSIVRGAHGGIASVTYTAERQALHAKLINQRLDGVKPGSGTVYMTGGGTASGKTDGILKNPDAGIPKQGDAAVLDPDTFKTGDEEKGLDGLPEYGVAKKAGRPWAAAHVHEESSNVTQQSISEALKRGHDVVYDSVADSGIDKLHAKVQGMRKAGARVVNADYATCSISTAMKRQEIRAQRTKRHVDPAILRDNHRGVTTAVLGAIDRGTFDRLRVWDTNGDKPRLIAETVGGKLKVHDDAAWKDFVAKGEE